MSDIDNLNIINMQIGKTCILGISFIASHLYCEKRKLVRVYDKRKRYFESNLMLADII